MDVLDQLMQEDDNPRGRASKFVSGNSLEEAAAAEQRRLEIKAQKWPIGRQEAGILHLIQSKTLFQRLKLPDPRWVDGAPRWDVAESRVKAAYEEMKKCCHPEWSAHTTQRLPRLPEPCGLLRVPTLTVCHAPGGACANAQGLPPKARPWLRLASRGLRYAERRQRQTR